MAFAESQLPNASIEPTTDTLSPQAVVTSASKVMSTVPLCRLLSSEADRELSKDIGREGSNRVARFRPSRCNLSFGNVAANAAGATRAIRLKTEDTRISGSTTSG